MTPTAHYGALLTLVSIGRVCPGVCRFDRTSSSHPGPEFDLHPLTRASTCGGSDGRLNHGLDRGVGQGRGGIGLHPATLGVIERLRLSVHQLSVPLHAASPAEPYTGWVLVADEPIARDAVETMTVFQPLLRALDRHIGALATVAETAEQPPLTPRERVVLGLLAEGLTAQAIASRLAVSRRTVHKHLEHLYRKRGATDRLTAVMRAQGRGWLPRPHAPGQSSDSATQSPR